VSNYDPAISHPIERNLMQNFENEDSEIEAFLDQELNFQSCMDVGQE